MAVKLELYRVFQEVARMGNISAAAQNLFISQSAVSQSVKQLEEQLQLRRRTCLYPSRQSVSPSSSWRSSCRSGCFRAARAASS